MTKEERAKTDGDGGTAEAATAPLSRRDLTPAARRALAEAQERRRAEKPVSLPPETGGRAGPDPARYGDWEKNGIISDF